MTTAQDSDMRNGLVASILCFMNEELKRDDVTPEKAESLEVATQCLKLAYHIPDLDDVQGPNLLEIYSKAVAQVNMFSEGGFPHYVPTYTVLVLPLILVLKPYTGMVKISN